MDFLVQDGEGLHAYEIKTSTAIDARDLKGFKRSMAQLGLKKGTVVYFGQEEFWLDREIEVRAVNKLLLS